MMSQAELRSDSTNSAPTVSGEPGAPGAQGLPHVPEFVIEPAAGWPALGLADLWPYRDLLFHLTLRNIKVRYKQTALGVLWAVLQPLLWMLVIWQGFTRWIPGTADVIPRPIFLFSGLLPWLFFQTAVTAAANSVVSSEGLVTKVYFPRLAIPFAAIAAALVDFGVSFVLLLLLMLWYGIVPGASLLLLPAAVLLLIAAATGFGTLMAALTVSYRDFRHAVAVLVQIWMFATPTIYLSLPSSPATAAETSVSQPHAADPQSAIPQGTDPQTGAASDQTNLTRTAYKSAGWLSTLNPMTGPIDFFRAATLGLPIPWGRVFASIVVNLAFCLAGIAYFRRVEDSFADVI
jgi:lipopolysaccharide transport system permease protein